MHSLMRIRRIGLHHDIVLAVRKLRNYVGLFAGLMLVLSCGVHTITGWDAVRSQLSKTNAGPDLAKGLMVSWMFGGMATLVMGAITVLIFGRRIRGQQVSLEPARVISIGYVVFALWVALTNDFDPFFLVFLAPAVLLGVASRD